MPPGWSGSSCWRRRRAATSTRRSKSSPALEAARSEIRRNVPHYAADRYLADELRWAQEAVLAGTLSGEVEGELFRR